MNFIIICCILREEGLFGSIFSQIQNLYEKIQYFIYSLMWTDFQKIFLSSRIGQLKKIFFKGRGFWGGSDEKMRRIWLGLGIAVVGLHPLTNLNCNLLLPRNNQRFFNETFFMYNNFVCVSYAKRLDNFIAFSPTLPIPPTEGR